jgi:hypothetical protein
MKHEQYLSILDLYLNEKETFRSLPNSTRSTFFLLLYQFKTYKETPSQGAMTREDYLVVLHSYTKDSVSFNRANASEQKDFFSLLYHLRTFYNTPEMITDEDMNK